MKGLTDWLVLCHIFLISAYTLPRQVKNLIGNVEKRCIDLGHYIVETGATVRQAAAVFGISKSTVHNDVTKRLSVINPLLCSEVKAVLEENKAERHIRGGLATRKKYIEMKKN